VNPEIAAHRGPPVQRGSHGARSARRTHLTVSHLAERTGDHPRILHNHALQLGPRTHSFAADRAGSGPLHFPSNALLCGLRVAVTAVTPAAGRGERVIGRNLDQDDPDAVGVLDPHLDQTPGLRSRLPDNRDSSRSQPDMLGVDIPDLDPDQHQAPGRAGRVPGDLEQPLAEEEHQPGIIRRTELPADGQAEQVTVEAVAAVQVAGAQQDPAAQDVHPLLFQHHVE
jgi:hypothetical protein